MTDPQLGPCDRGYFLLAAFFMGVSIDPDLDSWFDCQACWSPKCGVIKGFLV